MNIFHVKVAFWESGEVLDVYLSQDISLHSQKINGTRMRGRKSCAVVSSCLCGTSWSSEPGAPSWKELPHPPEQGSRYIYIYKINIDNK